MDPVFEWDPRKERANLGKHHIDFSEATSVFYDPLARIFTDEDHSVEERREIIIGHSRAMRLLVVCFTERKDRVRIISAGPATRTEQHDYEEYTAN